MTDEDAARVVAPSDGLREAVAVVIHRWKHPTYRMGEQGCRCEQDAAMAVDVAQPELAALATTGQPEPCQPKSDDRWLCDVHGGYFGGRTSGGSRCSAAQPEDTRTADPGGLRVDHDVDCLMRGHPNDQTGPHCSCGFVEGSALTPEATAPDPDR